MLIGVGEQRDRVYYYKGAPETKIDNTTRIGNLWHKGLGHSRREAMAMLSDSLGFSTSLAQNLEISKVYFHAK